MKLSVVRHGETDWNIQHRMMGQLDIGLNANGIAQAAAVAARLAGKHYDVIVSSDLQRAVDTARAIANEHREAAFVTDARFRERNIGIFQGLTRTQTAAMYPELIKEVQEDPWNAKIPEAETRMEMAARVREGLLDLRRQYGGQSVLLVTHGGVFQRLTEYLNEIGCACELGRQFPNTCVFVLDFGSGGGGGESDVPVILEDCDASHLDGAKTADSGHFQI